METNLSTMLKIHSNALVNLSIDGIIRTVEKMKLEEPKDDYDLGYRDAIDTVLIHIKQVKTNFNNLGKDEDERD